MRLKARARRILRRTGSPGNKAQAVAADDPSELHQVVAGLSEGVILIRPDQTIRWANKAALALHGVKTIAELGRDVDDYRRRFTLKSRDGEVLAVSNMPIERVVAGEALHDVVIEVRKADTDGPHWIHRVRSLVLLQDDGQPSCLVLIIHDLTREIEAEERFESAFGANPAPAAICRLSDLRFARVNEGFLQLTGLTRSAVIGRSVYEIDILHQARRRDHAIEQLKLGRTIPQMEACLRVPANPETWVIVAGQPIDMPRDVPCMLFTFADLGARRRAEQELKQSQELIAKSFQLIPLPILRWRRGTARISVANHAFSHLFGFEEREIAGDNDLLHRLWAADGDRRAFEKALYATGRISNSERLLLTKDGHKLLCAVSAEAAVINDEAWIIAVVRDLTERRRTESDLALAIEAAMPDPVDFSRKVMDRLAGLRTPAADGASLPGIDGLTDRERQILLMVAQGKTNPVIARELSLSCNTVRNHIAALFKKIGVNRRAAAVVYARERGLVTLKDLR